MSHLLQDVPVRVIKNEMTVLLHAGLLAGEAVMASE
jgi:hypothetical protein